jgi:hypothetical protein
MRDGHRTLQAGFLIASILICATASPTNLCAAEPDDNVVETFDVARHGDCLLVPVALGDRQFQFGVDTGSTFSCIDTELESRLDPVPGFANINGQGGHKRYLLREASVGKSRLPLTGKAVCADLSRFREATGYDIRGILGMNFLKSRVVQIDFDAGRLSILKMATSSAGTGFRLFYDKLDRPMLNLDITDGETIAIMVDTGMNAGLVLRSFRFDDLVESGRLEPIGPPALSATFEGNVNSREGRLDKFRLGDFTHERIMAGEGPQNRIGLGLLSRYVVTFDFPNDRLYLKPGKRFAKPDQFGWCGMPSGRIDGITRIKEVREGSAADKAGLKAGDEILRVDGKDAASLSMFEMGAILETGGRRVRLDVEGPDGRREVDIRVSGPVVD